MAPTGGPADKQGPRIEYTIPKTGTTNFKDQTFIFQFDEFVKRSSVQRAITIEPDLGIEYDVKWKRKQMQIVFQKPFPDSTTVIVKLGTDISDTRSNKMENPITLAISTGDEIDEGVITGRILFAETGKSAPDQKVLLYRTPFDLEEKAAYQAQTDTGGVFTFSYLAAGKYKALLVDDRNRNKIWDKKTEAAFPFSEDTLTVAKQSTDTLAVLYTARVDTIAPSLQGVGLFSQNRMRLRFSENIKLQEEAEVTVLDSAGSMYASVYPLYVHPKEPYVLFAQSENPLLETKTYGISLTGITDNSGNIADSAKITFTGTAQEDTTQQRIISTNKLPGLLQRQAFEVTYAAPISQPEIIDSLVVIEGQVDFDDWPEVETHRNKLTISPQKEWIAGTDYQFLVWNPVTKRRVMYEPEVWDSTQYGAIEINIESADSTSQYIVELLGQQGEEYVLQQFSQSVTLNDLPPLSYTLILFRDENGNQKWDRGTVIPFQAPEKYYVQRNVKVQPGFTSEIQVSLD